MLRNKRIALLTLALPLLLFMALGVYQLHLPGLHYDEAKEAGVNAMQLVTGQPVTAFRDATVRVGPWRLPLMVQDYIGALNVILATPFLALGGVNVVALRWLPLLIGALVLVLAWSVARRLGGLEAAAVTAGLLAVSPSFVFWNRQGIFVTNLTPLFFLASLLTGMRWWSDRRPIDLWLTALFWGLGIYSKLLFVWAIGAILGVAALAWASKQWTARQVHTDSDRSEGSRPHEDSTNAVRLRRRHGLLIWSVAAVCFVLPLLPLLVFNLQTGGTLASVFGNLDRSYYGVDNSAYLVNLRTRLEQLGTLLRGDHLWYLGGTYANQWALLLACALVAMAIIFGPGRTRVLVPVALLALVVAQSAFTVSDLFITHDVLLLPLIPLAAGLAVAMLSRSERHVRRLLTLLAVLAALWWFTGNLVTTIRYHRVLTMSGGRAAHSDATYNLAEYLKRGGLWAPVTLDWGLDAPVRFLTSGQVHPIEVFGYAGLAAPDSEFASRVGPFLENPDNIYLAHVPEETVFQGRVEALTALAAQRGLVLQEEIRFAERSGRPLIVLYRAVPPSLRPETRVLAGSGLLNAMGIAFRCCAHDDGLRHLAPPRRAT